MSKAPESTPEDLAIADALSLDPMMIAAALNSPNPTYAELVRIIPLLKGAEPFTGGVVNKLLKANPSFTFTKTSDFVGLIKSLDPIPKDLLAVLGEEILNLLKTISPKTPAEMLDFAEQARPLLFVLELRGEFSKEVLSLYKTNPPKTFEEKLAFLKLASQLHPLLDSLNKKLGREAMKSYKTNPPKTPVGMLEFSELIYQAGLCDDNLREKLEATAMDLYKTNPPKTPVGMLELAELSVRTKSGHDLALESFGEIIEKFPHSPTELFRLQGLASSITYRTAFPWPIEEVSKKTMELYETNPPKTLAEKLEFAQLARWEALHTVYRDHLDKRVGKIVADAEEAVIASAESASSAVEAEELLSLCKKFEIQPSLELVEALHKMQIRLLQTDTRGKVVDKAPTPAE